MVALFRALWPLAFVLFADEDAARPADDAISVHCLTKDKKVIPLYWQCGQLWTTNVKLPDLLLTNRGTNPVTPVEVEVVGMAQGRQVAVQYLGEDLKDIVAQTNPQFVNKLGDGILGEVMNPRLAAGFGTMVFGDSKLSSAGSAGTGECCIILLSNCLVFSYTGLMKVDDIRITLTVRDGTERKSIACPINFTPYETKGDYLFPLKGDLCVSNLPMNLTQHRKALSQEFAFDVMGAGPIEEGHGPFLRSADKQKLSDYPIFRREVVAVGDGTVAEVGAGFPEALMSNPAEFSEERFKELGKDLVEKIGYQNYLSGNYIVIDHENGEFSYYAHLSEDTIRVKPGDRVARGDAIAAVGNTGHSSEPHLHFQLMDSKDFLTANSLPVMFTDVPPSAINQNCTASNSLIGTDYVILRIGE
ncbi:MAG: M23 family metallopeptidase [Candidatus Hydrogenedentes bacterium]|nr:M23 family metallopeptidase [Candidatus Hydrogenedentota bacterium]